MAILAAIMADIIQLLPDSVANQIAAGEVVQRPASAVKELIENAIDAGADKIQVIVKDAGKSLIQVIDNGCGMSMTDARMCFERHATSKIRQAEDLFAIRTMGFRGEAMASIAAIAQIELKTRRHEDELGTFVQIEGSEIILQEPTSTTPGSNISIKNLFYNTPARRNFLKGNSVEMRHIIDEFQRVSLANPEIFFTLHHDGNEVFHLPKSNLKQRIVHLLGNSYNQRLVPVEEETTIITLKGYVGKPEFAKKTRGEQFFFVNNRFIKDSYLNHAVLTAFEELLPTDSYPLYVLFIDIDPAKIDINVHPTKTEIKYQDEKSIYAIIRSAVKRSLGRYNITPTLDFNQETGFSQMITPKAPEDIIPPQISFNPNFNPFTPEQKSQGNTHEIILNDRPQTLMKSSTYDSFIADKILARRSSECPQERNKTNTQIYTPEKKGIPQNWSSLYTIAEGPIALQETLPLAEETPQVTIADQTLEKLGKQQIFQLHNRFIISQIKSGFILIDQQAAHERILYERFLKQLNTHSGGSQQSLFPQTVDLSAGDFELIKELLPDIQSLGFSIREFGKNTVVVEGIPANIGSTVNEKELLEQLIEGFKNNRSHLQLNKLENLAHSMAKNAAIKSGTTLSVEEMNRLVDELFACELPNTSLHAKPIIITFTLDELIRKFENK